VTYHASTHDNAFFTPSKSPSFLPALRALLTTAKAMTQPTYSPTGNGTLLPPAYTFTRRTTRATETLANDGLGGPVRSTGMVRSPFRPSDDAGLFGFLVPANMMFARYLASAVFIVEGVGKLGEGEGVDGLGALADEMREFSAGIREGITRHGIVPVMGTNGSVETVYAYEVDGFGGAALMDDANVPSLLAAPVLGYLGGVDEVYRRTRARVLSAEGNPYYMEGSVINGIGGPHAGPGMVWPMASIVRILTSDDDDEIVGVLKELVGSTDGLGLMHESVNSNDASKWTRQW
jgi:meiotically up-regulated gene 157 (Mug157) protein